MSKNTNNTNIKEAEILIGTVDMFHSKKCYELYMYAVNLAKIVNSYLDNGYMVIDENELFVNKFIFYAWNKPCIAIEQGNCTNVYFGSTYDNNYKVWLHGEETKTSIKKIFEKFRFVKPCNIEKINFNKKC